MVAPCERHLASVRLANVDLSGHHTSGLDFAPAVQSKVKADAPIIVVQHGLSGGKGNIFCPLQSR